MISCGVIDSTAIGKCVSSNIDRGCSRCTWRKGCGINGRAGSSKITDRTTGYGDIASCKIGGGCACSEGESQSCVVGGRSICNGVRTICGGDGHGRSARFEVVNAHVTRVRGGAIVIICSDRDPVTARVHRNRMARGVICCLAINIILNLTPRSRGVFVNAHVTRVQFQMPSFPIAPIATRSPLEFIETEKPELSARCFPIDVSAELGPGTGGIFVDAHVTRVRCGAIIVICSDRDPITGRVHGNRIARSVICCLAIDVSAKLRPRTGGIFVDAHVTRVRGECHHCNMLRSRPGHRPSSWRRKRQSCHLLLRHQCQRRAGTRNRRSIRRCARDRSLVPFPSL